MSPNAQTSPKNVKTIFFLIFTFGFPISLLQKANFFVSLRKCYPPSVDKHWEIHLKYGRGSGFHMSLANFERMYKALFSPPDVDEGGMTQSSMDFFTNSKDAAKQDFKETAAGREEEQNPFIICLKGFLEKHA